MMESVQYFDTIYNFLVQKPEQIVGRIFTMENFSAGVKTRDAWLSEIAILHDQLQPFSKHKDAYIFFEYTIPRVDGRIDCGLIINDILFVIEFKTGGHQSELEQFHSQLRGYVLKLKYYHFESYDIPIVPILLVENAETLKLRLVKSKQDQTLYENCVVDENALKGLLSKSLSKISPIRKINALDWIRSPYCPTADIVEAARKLFQGHQVEDIKRSDAKGETLVRTTQRILDIIAQAKENKQKALCLITGVPGAGKTLIGLSIATYYQQQNTKNEENRSVYLSGNHPLVTVLQEALTRDAVARRKQEVKNQAEAIDDPVLRKAFLKENKVTKKSASLAVMQFIQMIYRWRAEYLRGISIVSTNGQYEIIEDKEYYKGEGEKYCPYDHVAIFDEAQRTWNDKEHSKFVRQHGVPDFPYWSEARFLLSCMDRHPDWAVVVCLVGTGQDINHGEAGIKDWIDSIKHFSHWHVYAPAQLNVDCSAVANFHDDPKLHLNVSLRSLRSESVSEFVDALLAPDMAKASTLFGKLAKDYEIVLTRNFSEAKQWLKLRAKGHERYGVVASSKAQRLRPLAIDVSHSQSMNVTAWFLNDKDDVHSSYYMEDIATEFQIQGLEIDWACVAWDGDLIFDNGVWKHRQFRTTGWQRINKDYLQNYHINAYRVLLTRARRGMVICIPEGDIEDPTRNPEYYDSTYEYLRQIGIPLLKLE